MERLAAELRAAGRRPFVDSARRVHADRRARLRARRRRARRRRRPARRHRPRVVVGRHAGRTDRRLRAVRAVARACSASAPTIRRRRSRRRFADLLDGMAVAARRASRRRSAPIAPIDVDDSQVGDGYGVPTPASTEALRARRAARGHPARSGLHGEGDGRAHRARPRRRSSRRTRHVLFWHTGGQQCD